MKHTYSVKANRDARAKELKRLGFGVRLYSIKNQRLNPKYVRDSGVFGPTQFGDDLEHFSTLYMIAIETFPPCEVCGADHAEEYQERA